MKRFALAGAVLALAVPATADAKPGVSAKKLAKNACTEQRAELSKKEFKAAYGAKAYGKCVSAWKSEAKVAKANAAHECKAERAADPTLFRDTHGTNANKSNAFGKCVSAKAKAQVEEAVEAEIETIENAAKECKAEREEMGTEAFRQQYGTNKNKRNAFGKCVSGKAAEAETETEEQAAA